jgi:mono/diheme cytochrome c family protein
MKKLYAVTAIALAMILVLASCTSNSSSTTSSSTTQTTTATGTTSTSTAQPTTTTTSMSSSTTSTSITSTTTPGSTLTTTSATTTSTSGSTTSTATGSAATFQSLSAAGQTVYSQSCAQCHGATGGGGRGPALWGSSAALAKYNTAQGLLSYTSATMPQTSPGSLTHQQYLNVLAYILLQANDVSGSTTFNESQLNSITVK